MKLCQSWQWLLSPFNSLSVQEQLEPFPLIGTSPKEMPWPSARKQIQAVDPGWGCHPKACRAQRFSNFVIFHLFSLSLTQFSAVLSFIFRGPDFAISWRGAQCGSLHFKQGMAAWILRPAVPNTLKSESSSIPGYALMENNCRWEVSICLWMLSI